ncbi:MAG: alpha/beta hydrolase [Actinomycetota bacterium]
MTTDPIADLAPHLDELHAMVLGILPGDFLDLSDVPRAREGVARFVAALPRPKLPDTVTVEDVQVPGLEPGDPEVMVRLYKPRDRNPARGGYVWIHGGGMVMGDVAMNDVDCARWATDLGCVVASVDYRLAPEAPFPAAPNDCYAGLSWFADNAAALDVDPGRIAIGGASAGGGLAAAVALMARDRGGPALCFQMLVFPMLDHRNETMSSNAVTDTRVWNRSANMAAWKAYLGVDGAGADGGQDETVSPYASPALAEDLSGLPPAYINVGEFDIFLDEDVQYAHRLMQAGVTTELHVYPGAFHGSNTIVADSPLSKRWVADEATALRAALTA